eukprot:584383-Alexandrium_andersonii.AAC.1
MRAGARSRAAGGCLGRSAPDAEAPRPLPPPHPSATAPLASASASATLIRKANYTFKQDTG